jgi:periplasmic protein TonB
VHAAGVGEVMRDRCSGHIGRRLWPVVLIVVGLHAALLGVPVRSMGAGGTAAVPAALQVRMLSLPAADPGPTPPARAGWSDARSDAQRAAPAEPAEPAEQVAAAPAEPAPANPAPEPTGASPPLPAIGIVVAGIASEGDYYPRSTLSHAPAPLAPVVIDYPAIANDLGHYRSELTLFIDETGRVLHVRVDGSALPAALEEAARRAFTGARFRAGEADGHAVRSRMRIEVDFDNRPPGNEQ